MAICTRLFIITSRVPAGDAEELARPQLGSREGSWSRWLADSEHSILEFPWFTVTILLWSLQGLGLKFFSNVPLFDSRHARYVEALEV